MRYKLLLLLLGLFSTRVLPILAQEHFQVGIGKVNITGDNANILDSLYVKAVVFKQGNQQVAIVECDIIEISSSWTILARKLASQKTGIPFSNICIAATHTHMDNPHKEVLPAAVKAIQIAVEKLTTVSLKSTVGQQFNVSHNRRYFMKDGSVVFNPMFLNPEIVKPAGTTDPDVGIVGFYDKNTNKPLLSLINFAIHLDIVKQYGAVYDTAGAGSRNSVSADFPYWIDVAIKQQYGSDCESIFLTGCCGNINHWNFSKPGPQSGWNTKSKEVGDSIYAAYGRALPIATVEAPALAIKTKVVNIQLQKYTQQDLEWAKNLQADALSKKSEAPSERQQFLNNIRRKRILWLHDQKIKGITSLPIEVQVIRLSSETVIVTLPGEMFVELGLFIKNHSPFKNTLIVEMSNSSVAYVPNKLAFLQGGYEVENSQLEAGGGEKISEVAIELLKQLKN
jgi:neutral ceramidase